MMSSVLATGKIAIIGGGVVGCALFRRFALSQQRPILIEAGKDILSGASKANSAMLHTGYDAPLGSLELACIKAGYREYMEIKDRLNLSVLETGGIMVAWNAVDLENLSLHLAHAKENGIGDVFLIDRQELRRREPNLSTDALGGMVIPGEHIIDPWSAPLAYVLEGIMQGGTVFRDTKVTDGSFDGKKWRLQTSQGLIESDIVVNAAGNFGDVIEAIHRPSPFRIMPRKGQFVVFDKIAHSLVHSSILPVPSERTKGIMMCRTAFGNLLVGPTAEDQEDRVTATNDKEQCERLIARGIEMLPNLKGISVTATYAGLRPATEFKDYQIACHKETQWITVAGIRSTGLTGALGIAAYVLRLYEEAFDALPVSSHSISSSSVKVPNLTDSLPRPYSGEEGADIVCHCESVTKSEIENALSGSLPAGDLGGLKRRTRAMMGRCQGFYCSARVRAIAKGKIPL